MFPLCTNSMQSHCSPVSALMLPKASATEQRMVFAHYIDVYSG
jgi:hypothetical protein